MEHLRVHFTPTSACFALEECACWGFCIMCHTLIIPMRLNLPQENECMLLRSSASLTVNPNEQIMWLSSACCYVYALAKVSDQRVCVCACEHLCVCLQAVSLSPISRWLQLPSVSFWGPSAAEGWRWNNRAHENNACLLEENNKSTLKSSLQTQRAKQAH